MSSTSLDLNKPITRKFVLHSTIDSIHKLTSVNSHANALLYVDQQIKITDPAVWDYIGTLTQPPIEKTCLYSAPQHLLGPIVHTDS